jgi:hypothetical protein
MKKLTAAALFTWADQYARAAEAADRGTVYPTMREATKQFRTTQDAIEETVGDYCGDGYLGIAVGFKNGNGHATYKHRGDYRIEAYKDQP